MISPAVLASVKQRHGHQRLHELDGERYVLVADIIDELLELRADDPHEQGMEHIGCDVPHCTCGCNTCYSIASTARAAKP